jgi:hypothetical protein
MNRSQRQRAENEVVFKRRNDSVKRMAKDLQHNGLDADIALQFTCECSDENCRETVGLTVSQYESARGTDRQFIIKPGHEQTDIERVIAYEGFSIVEKFQKPPKTDGKSNNTSATS